MKNCKNCKYAVIRRKADDNAPNVVCMKRTNFDKGIIYLTQEDANCRNYFMPVSADTCVSCGEVIPEGRQVCPRCEKGDK